jgi:hypothetical protein
MCIGEAGSVCGVAGDRWWQRGSKIVEGDEDSVRTGKADIEITRSLEGLVKKSLLL